MGKIDLVPLKTKTKSFGYDDCTVNFYDLPDGAIFAFLHDECVYVYDPEMVSQNATFYRKVDDSWSNPLMAEGARRCQT